MFSVTLFLMISTLSNIESMNIVRLCWLLDRFHRCLWLGLSVVTLTVWSWGPSELMISLLFWGSSIIKVFQSECTGLHFCSSYRFGYNLFRKQFFLRVYLSTRIMIYQSLNLVRWGYKQTSRFVPQYLIVSCRLRNNMCRIIVSLNGLWFALKLFFDYSLLNWLERH